ncbi:MAG TPA: hypothetical protein PKH07_18250, partial [bacterium]|nr:hypothetical protein [bacterium]
SGLHSEVFNHGRMVALGVNVEMSNDFEGTEPTQVIGVNIQATHGKRPMQYGMQIHTMENGNYFEKALGLNGIGDVGIEMNGTYKVGINAQNNTIRVNEGTCIELDGKGAIRLRYKDGRIEFLNGDKCFGHLDVNGEDHAL